MLGLFSIIGICCFVFFVLAYLFNPADGDDYGTVDHTGHLGSDDGGQHGITFSNILTIRNFMMFGVGFGAAGAIAKNSGLGDYASIGIGLLLGTFLVIIGVWFFALIHKQEGNTTPRAQNLVGKLAKVLNLIPGGPGLGEITTNNEFGSSVTLYAQAENPITAGTSVLICSVLGNVARVSVAN